MILREATGDDVDVIKWALYVALDWDPAGALPPFEWVMAHPEAERFHRDWGRPGDLGVIASIGHEVVGVAYCRLFTDDDHGEGYVDRATPEVAVAVREGHRGGGTGERLLRALAELARANGFDRLSLSVAHANPARRLYERLGYRTVAGHGDDPIMLLELR